MSGDNEYVPPFDRPGADQISILRDAVLELVISQLFLSSAINGIRMAIGKDKSPIDIAEAMKLVSSGNEHAMDSIKKTLQRFVNV